MAIEAAHYEETRRALMADPVVETMAAEVDYEDWGVLFHRDGTPRFSTMTMANRVYDDRGGIVSKRHIGAVAEALYRLRPDGANGEIGK